MTIPINLTKLKRKTTTLDIGTTFEKHCLRYLNNELYMNLRRVGGANDGGIDLRGYWWLPRTPEDSNGAIDTTRRIRVITQCKAENKKLGPRAVRELEGVMANLQNRNIRVSSSSDSLPPTTNSTPSKSPHVEDAEEIPDIGILCSQSGFTKSTMLYSNTSNIPLMLIHLPGGRPVSSIHQHSPHDGPDFEESSNEGDGVGKEKIEVSSLWWNKSLSEGILGNSLEIRKTVSSTGVGIGLWMDGKKLGRVDTGEGG